MNMQLPIDLARNIDSNIQETDITLLNGGFSSQAYKVESKGNSYVLLIQKDGAVSTSQCGHAFVVLTLLDSIGYAFSPKPIWLHPEERAIIISYFAGTASDKFDFDASSVSPEDLSLRVIDAIFDTASVSRSKYENLCKEYTVKPLPVGTPADSAKQFGTDWFGIVEKSCPDQEIIDWLRLRVAQSIETANNIVPNDPSLGITDPSNPNILINNEGDFMLIDWDSASYNTFGPEFYISYTTHLTNFMKPFRHEIIKHVSRRFDMSPDDLEQKVYEHRRYYEVFDVNWAAMMMARVNAGEIKGDIDEFRKMAEERIAVYLSSFES